MVTPEEVERGIAVKFDPEVLRQYGAVVDGSWMSGVTGVHYFVCVSRIPSSSVWVPAYSRQTSGRIPLRWKGGDPAWVEPGSFVDLSQMWFVPDRAIEPGSSRTDRTRRGHRNHASLYFLLGGHLGQRSFNDHDHERMTNSGSSTDGKYSAA